MKKNKRLDKKQVFSVKYNNPKNRSSDDTLKTKKREVKKMDAKKEKSEWLIVSPNGSIVEASQFNWKKYSDIQDFYRYESAGSREIKETPAHVKMMQQLELVNYEPAADPGNFRWLPKGHLIKRLMEEYVSRIVRAYGGMQVESPIMYDLNHPQLSRYLERFPARQYQLLSEEKKYFLRFAACFGQYLIMRDMQISYQQLPVRLYELTHYSFRRELSGELAGLRRLRGFTMPDMHTLCANVEQAKTEFHQQYMLCKEWMKDLELDYVMAIRVVEDFFDQNRGFILDIVKDFGQPVLLERWKERSFYFILKFEFNVVDPQKKAAALSTVQIDVENAERFGIQYIKQDGKPKHPLLLHASISGSIDRNLYALLEQQTKKIKRGEIPKLPYWLYPSQVRLIPVADRHLSRCLRIASQIQARVEVDDRNETVARKIREAEVNWIPFIGVVGDKEIGNGMITVRERGVSSQKEIENSKFSQSLNQLQGDKPFEPLSWPRLLSKQPRFR